MAEGIDLSHFEKSSIWDLIDCPASYNPVTNQITYKIILRRKGLFYSWVLLIPSVLLAIISSMVFYIPTESREKIGLLIYVLLSIIFFLVMVSKILPQTSLSIPMISKYQVLTLALNIVTILVQVIIINMFYRGQARHQMPKWVRVYILDMVARLMVMRRPKYKSMDSYINRKWAEELASSQANQSKL